MSHNKRPFDYGWVCPECGAFKIGTREEVTDFRKSHKIKVEPPKELLANITSTIKPKFRMCPVMQVVDIKKKLVTYARPDLAKHLGTVRGRV